jgi:CBS domain-containing protein
MKTRTAAEIMTHPVVTIAPEARLTDAIKLLLRHHISGLPVVDAAGALVGILTEHDILNFALSGDADDTAVSEAMTREVVSFPPETQIPALVEALSEKRLRRVPIVGGGRVAGIVSRRDILREMMFLYARY